MEMDLYLRNPWPSLPPVLPTGTLFNSAWRCACLPPTPVSVLTIFAAVPHALAIHSDAAPPSSLFSDPLFSNSTRSGKNAAPSVTGLVAGDDHDQLQPGAQAAARKYGMNRRIASRSRRGLQAWEPGGGSFGHCITWSTIRRLPRIHLGKSDSGGLKYDRSNDVVQRHRTHGLPARWYPRFATYYLILSFSIVFNFAHCVYIRPLPLSRLGTINEVN
ncbi:hypothetical protein OF83DRAFT_881471 [Amylostereum chailletii]|nr:hypothetical protein OF83DRAFT_881471 [Amylostereum chailletii]